WTSLVSLGGWRSGGPHPSAATARDNGASDRCAKNILCLKMRPGGLHSSAVQHHSATLRPSLTRGAPMMTLSSRVAAVAIASLFLIGSAFAQTTTPATPAPAAKAAPADKMAPAEKKAE